MTNNDDLALKSRIEKALTDFTNGRACMHVPAQETDVDLVLADCLALLAERDADKALIAKMATLIAEMEFAATDKANRIAELEARTVSVKLPEPATEGGRGYRQKVIWVLKEALFDAGINLEVGE